MSDPLPPLPDPGPALLAEPPSPGVTPRDRAWRAHAGSLALQLLVVFVGVYAAFALERWREARQVDDSRAELYATLIGEVESVSGGMASQLARFDSVFVAPLAEGRAQPLRPYYQINASLASPEVQALLGVVASDPEQTGLTFAYRRYNMSLGWLTKVSDEFRRQSVEHIAPALSGGASAFYTADGALRPEYGWYAETVRYQRMAMASTVEAAETLADHLRRLAPDADLEE